ncbi:4-(cytidine 5'-diphospho)-2-C-methyl-D-erythritol kinase [Vagococcus zengguangii]|uniref:4-diphosphocytidyl-2-C-methyl-D-erythritol kinase n=1 Tax=Vagococcus zengguangii TaxID=2571750 RepID=A0A4D7CRK3_9ENTE|nr:4-(cytidine 5'-diphospho)-2-C-methyl-D-erythritol kinase [Vagococcus zengguangii]QCI85643.1 4-(cytidine 5'-diphospho)-2-C-methyl-D-erythritol kinase [Vagococcus zengguangii]TLG81583.1 4-(cytidine 5'-diphospho)-2-C-methyl-D-erythritol kinase [Vagococcus zengguangii]
MEIIEKAPAKINLGLDILGKRPDGYHDLEMIMASVDLADKLIINELPQDKIIVRTNATFLPVDEKNNVYQAVALVKEQFGIKQGLSVEIKKTIPVAAGLGGGSSDAAAVLRGVNKLWRLGLSKQELSDIGFNVGTDVPYCVHGTTAFVAGRGEIVEPLPPMPQCWVVIVKPQFSVSTRKIFADFDMTGIEHPDIPGLKASILEQDYDKMISLMGNSMERATMQRRPVVREIKEKMMKYGADAALMSGSGPTVFGLCQNYSRAKRVYNAFRGFCKEVHLVRTINQ